MLIPYLSQVCFFFSAIALNTASNADIYKWVDENGQPHYSQQAPIDKDVDNIKIQLPPSIYPAEAQKEIDELIKQQQDETNAKQKELEQQQLEAQRQQTHQEICKTAKSNLQKYQDNPGRLITLPGGIVTRLSEEERQQKINYYQEKISKHCQ